MKRFKTLIWLRYQYLISNKILLFICALTPLIDFAILQAIPFIHGEIYFLNMGLSLVYSMTAGSFTSMMISEEKEKKNLRTLILSGVKKTEYVISVVLFPFIFSFISEMLMPILFGISILDWLSYSVVVLLTTLAFILLNLSIGMFAKTQIHATSFSMTIVVLATFLPLLSSDTNNKIFDIVTKYSFFGANAEYFQKLTNFKISDPSILAMIFWIIILFIVAKYAFEWNGKEH